MSRRSSLHLSGIESGFLICQIIAVMMLWGIVGPYLVAKLSFHGSEEYLPVDVTYTETEMYTEEGETYYLNIYSYVVNGEVYRKEETSSVAVEPGTQKRYYCPTDPQYISDYPSPKEMMADMPLGNVIIPFVIFESIAVFFLIKIIKKKRAIKIEHTAYEAKIRSDMQKNRDLYKSLGFRLDEQKLFSTLEPLRQRIAKNQKALEGIERRSVMASGSIALTTAYAVVAVIDHIRMNKIQKQLDTDLRKFYTDYKRNIGEPVLRQLLEDFQYRPEQGFSAEEVKGFGVYRSRLSHCQSEDYIEGVYKGVHYRQADVKIERQQGESELSVMTQGLMGRISVYDFKKNLDGDIVIRSKQDSDGVIANLTKVNMENVAFNEKFEIYAKSAHMVFYLLTPQFMEYLLKLDLGGRLVLRFTGNRIIVLRNRIAGIFEPDLKQPLDIPYEIGKSYQELKDILDFIDILNLDKVAEEANARAEYGESIPFDAAPDTVKEKPAYGVVNQEDSIFGGPDFLEPDISAGTGFGTENEELENWNKPASSGTGSSGFKLKL